MAAQLEDGVRLYLISKPGVAGLVKDRIFPQFAAQNKTKPYVVYNRIAGSPEYHLLGEAGMSWAAIQFDCYGGGYDASRDLAEQLRLVLSGYNGGMGAIRVRAVFLTDESDVLENPVHGNEKGDPVSERVYRFWYQRPVPVFT